MRANFDEYSARYSSFAKFERGDDGILEIRFHTNGGRAKFDGALHRDIGDLFSDVGQDLENRVIILTGTDDAFLLASDMDMSVMEAFLPYTAAMHSGVYGEILRLINCVVDVEMPMISALNGPVTVHAEIPVLADIVIATEDTYFSDDFHFINGVVPGDGAHVIWPYVLGNIRAKYFLLTAQRVTATEAHTIGFVHEIVDAKQLVARAWELARELAKQPDVTLRATRALFTQPLKKLMLDNLPLGAALEGLGSCNHFPTTLQSRP